jgi:glycosyltransferase involved in cell wall biosynthesis
MFKLVVVIPTFNNPATLRSVVDGVRSYCKDIIVVDDGSGEDGAKIAESLVGITLIRHSRNLGKGPALGSGLKKAKELGFTHSITIDADGQHFPDDIVKLAEAAEREPETLFIGARSMECENMPGKNTFANRFSNFWFFAETGIKLSDTQSGFRVYPLEKLAGIKILTGRYEWELEIIVRAAWMGIKVENIPIKVYYPPAEERVSHFKPLKDFTRISLLNTFLVVIALFWWWPLKFFKWFTRENIDMFIKEHITESKESNYKISASVGLGLFFGISPLWGYQMITAVAVAHFLRLNKVLTLVASNISIPPMIPFILYGSFVAGSIILGEPLNVVPSNLTLDAISGSLVQYLVGSFAFAFAAGIVGMAVSYIFLSIFRRSKL